MIQHFKRPSAMVPGSAMPPIQLSDVQLNTLAAFLLKLNARNAEALQSAPDFAVEGALVYQKSQCGSCHTVNAVGVKLGPPLNGLKQRRTPQWVEDHFRNPQALSPGSIMPPYRFTPTEMEKIVAYLFVLPE
jgi:cbb3-type cytochrome oxidase cytochrome c subunit